MSSDRLSADRLYGNPLIKEMLNLVDNSPHAYMDGMRLSVENNTADIKNPRTVVFYGLGGSGIVGDMCASMFGGGSTIPIVSSNDPFIPAWVTREDLLVVISYSGDTLEALRAFYEGRMRRSRLAVITSGGKLGREAGAAAVPLLKVPSGLTPRMALPNMVGASTLLLSMADVVKGATESLRSAVGKLLILREQLGAPSSDNNLSKEAAAYLNEGLPHVCCSQHLNVVGYRLKNQLNENAKYPCIVHEIPEAMHNTLESLPYSDVDRYVSIRSQHESVDVSAQYEFLKSVLGLDFMEVRFEGEPIYEIVASTLWADYTSIYLAALRDVDPITVNRIKSLRGFISQKIGKE